MAITLTDASSAMAAPPSRVADAPKKPAATQADDIPSARVAARLSGKRVEALSERTETSTTWANKDGSLTTELTAGPVRFERDGKWTDVDVELRESGSGVEPVAHPEGLRLSGKTGTPATSLKAAREAEATDLVTLGEGDQRITLQWKGGLPKPKLDGTRAEYVNAVPGADVVVEATRTGFEQFVEIKKRPGSGAFSYTLPLKAKGLKVKQLRDGSVQFTDKKNKKRAVMPAPVMWDTTVDKRSGKHTRRAEVGLKVVKKGSSVDLVITPDAKFLADPDTKYPVTVDPSTSSLSNVFDTYVQQGETVDWSNDTELDFGNPGTKNPDGTPRTAQSFISWNTTPVQDALVLDAKLSLWNFHSGNTDCKLYPWEVWSSGAASTSSRWTNRPTMTAKKATSTETRGNAGCATQPDGWINADVTALLQEWASAKAARGHMGIRASDESVVAQWKRVNSANAAANPPKLVVKYNYRPRTGTQQEAGPPYFLADGVWSVNTATPTLRDTFVDTDGDKVNGTFQIYDSATNTQVGDVLVSPFVPSGQPASVTVPAGVLANGKTYKFRTSPYDGTHYNAGWSSWATFRVDTTSPSAPVKVASTDYPTGQWVKGAGQAGTFAVTPPTGSDHRWFEWSLDGVEWTKKDANGGNTVNLSVTPETDGTHTLQVRSVDAAGNTSEAVEYPFHAGPGGFVSPHDGERTARRLSLVAEADAAKYDKVTFSWRRSAEDAWATVPPAAVTVGGQPLSAWPVPLTDGKNEAVVWKATDTVDPDGTIEIKAGFTGPEGAATSTEPIAAIVDRFADTAASTQVGPGHLNLLTGDYKITGTEVSHFGLSASRVASSRRPAAGATRNGQAAIFGAEWLSGVVGEVSQAGYTHIRKTSGTSLDVVLEDGTSIYFTAKGTGWVPEPGAEALDLTGSFADGFTLDDTEGTRTVFAKVADGADTWQITSSGMNGVSNSSTEVVSEAVTVDGKVLARPKLLVASGGAVAAKTCAQTPSTRGCRVLEFEYAEATTATADAFGDYKGQLKKLKLWSTEKGDTAATARAVQTYAYDSSGRLRETWNPQVSPALKTAYGYDADGRVTKVTPPGQLPWTLGYGNVGGTAGGDGMLTTVKRATLAPGSPSQTNGEAVTSVVYDVPVSGATAPYAMNTTAVRQWGQHDAPTDATAVFPADSVPSSYRGGELTSGSYGRAVLHYLDASGNEINTIDEAGGTTVTERDKHGNTVRQMTAGDHALALGKSDADKKRLADLGIAGMGAAERAWLLSTTARYNDNGTRVLEHFGPLRRIDLTKDFKDGDGTVLMPAGTSVAAQPWTVNEYDEGRPTDGTAVTRDQQTMEISGARVRGYDSVLADKRLTETQYDWAKGLPTYSIEDPGGKNLVTTTEYDAQGRVTAVVPPGGTGQDATSRITVYWSGQGTGWCEGRPEWVGLECWSGPAGDITGGGGNPAQLVDATTEYGFYGEMTERTETSGAQARTVTVTHDSAGRVKSSQTDGGQGAAVTGSSFAYDEASGQVTTIQSQDGGVIRQAFDALGRLISYTDADNGVTKTEYDAFHRPTKVSDSVPSSVTYAYDHEAEPRGLVTSMTDSVAGTFRADYDLDGVLVKESLPGGYTMTQTGGKAGLPNQRTYTRDADGEILLTDTVRESVHEEWTTHIGGAGAGESQTYAYDSIGRLTTVEDTYDNVCTTRTYAFDNRTNRTSLTTAKAEAGAACTTSGGTQVTHGYDSANRIVDSGYAYDSFGRTTQMPGGTSVSYYANDLVRQQTSGSTRQTWALDAANRFRGWTTESKSASGAWSQTGSKTNHYGGPSDNPRWIKDNTEGTITRMVGDLGGGMSATTAASGSVVLQLANLHGDISLMLPLDTSVAPVALSADEYGNQRSGRPTARYNWLGGHQRSAETPTGAVLMGVRLYNPGTGRFLQVDPVFGGSRNAYEYAAGNPVTNVDLDGRRVYRYSKRTLYRSWGKVILIKWTNKSNMKRTYTTRWTLNKRWTDRVANYGADAAGLLAIAAGVTGLFTWGVSTLILLALSAVALTLGIIAKSAVRRGQCLSFYSTTTLVYRKTWGWTHFAYYYGYAYAWRARC